MSRWSALGAPPVALSNIDVDGLVALDRFLGLAGTVDPGEVECLAQLVEYRSGMDATDLLVTFWRQIAADDNARTWLLQRGREAGEALRQRQELLMAAELAVAGGHIPWASFDDVAPEDGWMAGCGCGCLETKRATQGRVSSG